ncbi:MAG: 1-acyl-sn-glycerol-3-phosphate acyltransferase [Bacillales bacterium]|nr:1-acyl-sn-glycerol-3-phosphate acyltransferase [Bacillales bacterium]
MEKKTKLYAFLKKCFSKLFLWYFNAEIINKEYANIDGPVIIACNHRNAIDPAFHVIASDRMIHYMAKKECFDNKLVSWFFKDMGCIPVDRKVKNELAKKEAIKLLNEGLVLGIFPEGTRNRTSELLLPFKYGAVSLAFKTGAYIVPAGITGKYKFRGKIKVKYGKPFKVSNDLESANVKLKEEITKLIKE